MRPILLIHIPKNAGTSIINSSKFQERWRQHPSMEVELDYDSNKNLCFGHIDTNEIRKRNLISDEDWNNYYKICFVRNPWDRAVSLYEYMKSARGNPDISFTSFVFNLNEFEKIGFYNEKGFSQARPQVDWIPSDIDYIGKVETIHSDIERIQQITQGYIPHPKKENVTQSRENKDYREYFPDNQAGKFLKEAVTEFYQEDIKRFNYTF